MSTLNFPFETSSLVVCQATACKLGPRLMDASVWYVLTPLPDNQYRFDFKPDACKIVDDALISFDVRNSAHRPTCPPDHHGILREWVEALPERMQGTLLTVIRGCDTVERNELSKRITRIIRGLLLYTRDPNPSSFIMFVDWRLPSAICQCIELVQDLTANHDHLPHHYLMHLVHACEIIGYKHPDPVVKPVFLNFYAALCGKFHMNEESEEQLDRRLCADEETFKANQ